MPYSESLAERIRRRLARRKNVEEKKMFGGIGFMLNGNMCVGVWKGSVIARVGPEQYEAALGESFVSEFDITGRAMAGWVLVSPKGVEDDDQLRKWIDKAATFSSSLMMTAIQFVAFEPNDWVPGNEDFKDAGEKLIKMTSSQLNWLKEKHR